MQRKAATQAHGPVTVPRTAGAVVPAGARLIRLMACCMTRWKAQFWWLAATLEVLVVDAGLLGDQVAGTALQFVSPVAGVNSDACCGINGGTDIGIEDRPRVLERYRLAPRRQCRRLCDLGERTGQASRVRGPNATGWGPARWARFVVNDAATPITLPRQSLQPIKAGIEAKAQ